jgi:hypothetical protein
LRKLLIRSLLSPYFTIIMANQKLHLQRACLCKKSAVSYSSPLLFLLAILPKSSYAQLTSQSISATPTTLLTSTSSNSFPASSASSATSSSGAASTTDPNGDNGSASDNGSLSTGTHTFNYYFVIVAVAAVVFGLALLYFGKRKKQKAALMHYNSQRALAQDVSRFNPRTRGNRIRGNGRALWNGTRREDDRVEGLDERGEPPPPYVLGGKPPSVRSRAPAESLDLADERISHADAVELNTLAPNMQNNAVSSTTNDHADPPPPSYDEHISQGSEDIGDISRPTAAATILNRHESSRRLLGSSIGSTG